MTDSYPALIELISRLEGKDRKTCELALYCLNKADKRDTKLRAQNEQLRAALTPFAEADWCEVASFSNTYFRAAKAALEGK